MIIFLFLALSFTLLLLFSGLVVVRSPRSPLWRRKRRDKIPGK